jgi:hypothetical protein
MPESSATPDSKNDTVTPETTTTIVQQEPPAPAPKPQKRNILAPALSEKAKQFLEETVVQPVTTTVSSRPFLQVLGALSYATAYYANPGALSPQATKLWLGIAAASALAGLALLTSSLLPFKRREQQVVAADIPQKLSLRY